MADVTVLRCWPSCVNAIDWSPDGIIALASDELVELLFPNTIDFERDNDVPQWQHVPLKVPLFSLEELPIKEPATTSIYSIGEEISSSAPIKIAWSMPGLAKHKVCALATLTANSILSIWSSEGNPQEESSWSRKLLINDAIEDYFLRDAAAEPSHVTASSEDRLRLRSRVRDFAWAPSLPSSEPARVVGTRLVYGPHIVATANHDNQLVFVAMNSPTSTLGKVRSWNANVLTHCSLRPDVEAAVSGPVVFEELMNQQRHICHVAWSPWIARDDFFCSVITYATNEDVRARTVHYVQDAIELGDEVTYESFELRYNGPLTWCPKIEGGDKFKLALITHSGLAYLTISAHDASVIEKSAHDLDQRWDPISGTVWDTAQDPSHRLHLSSLLSTLHNPTAVLDVSTHALTSLGSPNWREQIENNLALFSVKNGLKGNSKAKVWGLTSSPLGDYIAACTSLHPSDMIEYGIAADRRGTVSITSLRQHNEQRSPFPNENVSAEGVAYTLRKLAENTVEDPDMMSAFSEEMAEKLFQAFAPPQNYGDDASVSIKNTNASDLHALIATFKRVAFLDQYTVRDRYSILSSHACKNGSSNELPKTLIACRLALALQRLPASLFQTTFSTEILTQHQELIALVHGLAKSNQDVTGSGMDDDNSVSNAYLAVRPTDTCDFCSAPIPFTDLASATCTNGHQFPRCGLSLLPIQAPGITKYCGICSTPFLNEEFVMAQEDDPVRVEEDEGRDVVMVEDMEDHQSAGKEGQGQTSEENMQAYGEGDGQPDGGLEQPNGTPGSHSNGNANEWLNDSGMKRDLSVTLARVLFLACDVCVYCGGKFVG